MSEVATEKASAASNAIERHLKNKQLHEVLWKDLPTVINRTVSHVESDGTKVENVISYSRGRYLGKVRHFAKSLVYTYSMM